MEKNSSGNKPRPMVGIGILIENKKGEVLLGERMNAHGEGEWSFPGGHLEFGETIFETAKRDVREETGLDIDDFDVISLADEMRYIKSDGRHYLNIGIKGKYKGGEPRTLEPDKCRGWKWISPEKLPQNLFEGTMHTINNYKAGRLYQLN